MKLTKTQLKEIIREEIQKIQEKIEVDDKIRSAAKRINVRNWYMKTYRTDELGDEINKKLTLWDVYAYLSRDNVYKLIGVHDSVIRERVFEKMAEVFRVKYDDIYDLMNR